MTSVLQDYAQRLRDAQELKEQTQETVNTNDQIVKVLEAELIYAKTDLAAAISQRNSAMDSVYVLKQSMQELIKAS